MAAGTLDPRAHNRALLARQGLLERGGRPAAELIEHLVGQQAQVPGDPYVGLWSRIANFDPGELSGLLGGRAAVRAPLMRSTIHLVSARDLLTLRPLMQVVLARTFSGQFGKRVAGLDLDELLAAGRALVEERPRTRAELRRALAPRWPEHDAEAVAMAVTFLLPLVQVTPRGLWRRSGQAAWSTPEAWLGSSLDRAPSLEQLVLRYLAAFGPATVMDIQAWCGLTKLRAVTEALRPRLRAFRAHDGRELLDLPRAPRPDPDTPAPVRFLPEYDNVMLAHADRGHIAAPAGLVAMPAGRGGPLGTFLVDGRFGGMWRIPNYRGAAVLRIEPVAPLARADAAALQAEGERLLAFLAADAGSRDIDLAAP